MGKVEPLITRKTAKRKTAAKRKIKTNPKKGMVEPIITRKTTKGKTSGGHTGSEKNPRKRKSLTKGAEFKRRSAAAKKAAVTRKKNAAKRKAATRRR